MTLRQAQCASANSVCVGKLSVRRQAQCASAGSVYVVLAEPVEAIYINSNYDGT